jgi:hypothetical protein
VNDSEIKFFEIVLRRGEGKKGRTMERVKLIKVYQKHI